MTSKENECTGDFGCPHCEAFAASKLPSAPSPAGETASETPDCCGGIGPCKYCTPDTAVHEPVFPEGAEPMCQSRSSAGHQCIQSVAGHRKYHSTVAAPIGESEGGVFWDDSKVAAPIAPAAAVKCDHSKCKHPYKCCCICGNFKETAAPIAPAAVSDNREQCCKAWHASSIARSAQEIGQVDLMQEAFYQGWDAHAAMSAQATSAASPVAGVSAAISGSVAGWTLYRAVRDFLDSARSGTPFGLEVMDAAVSEWEAENPPTAQPSAEGDGWIAVTPETMPTDRAVVQCYRAGYQYVCVYRADSMWPFQTHSGAYVAATHWRSLPAPPSGQGEVR